MTTGADLIKEIDGVLRRHLRLREPEYIVMAPWIIHTFCFDLFRHTPYLLISSPEKQSGKSTMIDLLALLVANPKRADSISVAALYRITDAHKPTLMLDELDALTRSSKETAEAIRGILNSGFKRNGTVTRCAGKNMDLLAEFRTYCPKVLSGIGKTFDTVHDRSITIRMRRLAPDESVEPIDEEILEPKLLELRASIEGWTKASKSKLQAHTEPIAGLRNQRQQDIARPLIAVAQAIGGDQCAAIRRSLVEIFTAAPAEDQSHRSALLADVRRVFREQDTDRLATDDVLSLLKAIEGAPWSDWNKGRGISSHNLSETLKEFDVEPRTIRLGSITKRGYKLEWFADAFNRWLPAETTRDGDEA